MDGRKNNGGARLNSGRKKGIGKYFTIKKVIDDSLNDMFSKLLDNEEIKNLISKEINKTQTKMDWGGWVYLIKNKTTNNVKIGITAQDIPKRRLSHYRTHGNIELIYIDSFDDYIDIEIEIHEKYKDYCIKGEWFYLSDNQIIDIIIFLTNNKYKNKI